MKLLFLAEVINYYRRYWPVEMVPREKFPIGVVVYTLLWFTLMPRKISKGAKTSNTNFVPLSTRNAL